MKMIDALNFLEAYSSIKNKPLKINIIYKLSKCLEECEKERDFYQQQLANILNKYAKKDENDNFIYTDEKTGILINESQQQVCEKELSELLTLDININEKYFIKITDIADLELDIETFNKIKPFIVFFNKKILK